MKWWTVFGLLVVALYTTDAQARLFARFWASNGGVSRIHVPDAERVVDPAPVYDVEKRLLERINQERARYGLRALILDPVLHMRSRIFCGYMARRALAIAHSDDPSAENVALGQSSADEAVNTWMNSPGHRANILNPNYSITGISAYSGPNGNTFWCQQFD